MAPESKRGVTVGLISDTHGLLRPEAVRALAGVQRIIHAGDIGAPYCRSSGPGVRFGAVVALSSNSSVASGRTERRQAIWPWLVMPLLTLALFFALYRLHQKQNPPAFEANPESTTNTPFASRGP
ncbi:MAG: hypothetical protein ACREVV_14835 [Steroidobacteraceae bacterium]